MGLGTEIVGSIFSLAGGVCFGVSMGTHYWFTYAASSDVSVGLFLECVGSICADIGK